MCGFSLQKTCQNCGNANPINYRFCNQCGTGFSTEIAAAPRLNLQAAIGDIEDEMAGAASKDSGSELAGLQGERRIASVILADVTDSTDLMEKIGTEAWVGIMNRVFQILEGEIYRFGGAVEQFRGDGLVAFFGARTATEDDPEHAVLAGLAMQKAVKPYAERLSREQDIDLRLRVGVNTGEVIVTMVGDRRQHMEDTAMGEAVALAARMETAAEPGTVLVSENTYRLVIERFDWEELGEITVKGVSQPVSVFRPLGPRTDGEHSAPVSSLVMGRKKEFQILHHALDDLQQGQGAIAIVTGEKGMGKSLLVSQIRQHMLDSPHYGESDDQPAAKPLWLAGRCRSYDNSWPYSMWREVFKRWLGTQPEDDDQDISSRLLKKTTELWGAEAGHFYPYLGAFLSIPIENHHSERLQFLSAEDLQQEFHLTICQWIEKLAEQGPVVFSFVDIQWADSISIELLKQCLALSEASPVLWILQLRPLQASAAWTLQDYVKEHHPQRLREVNLHPLTQEESRELIEYTVGSGVLDNETIHLIIDRAEGSPLFVQELIYMLVDQGVLVRSDTPGTVKWSQVRPVTSLDLPGTLQNLVLARIDRLSPAERRTLQMAAVIGPIFWTKVLEALSESNHVTDALRSLVKAHLIELRGELPGVGAEFVFHSSLVREVAYDSVLTAQRNDFHLRIATFLEDNLEVEIGEQFDSTIAYHYRCSGNLRKELFYTLTAAETARKFYANAEALAHYDRALELLECLEEEIEDDLQREMILGERFEVLASRSEILRAMGNIGQSLIDVRKLVELAERMPDDPVWMIDAILHQPEVVDPDTREQVQTESLPLARRAHELAVGIADQRRIMHSLIAIGSLQLVIKDPAWFETAEEALEIARRLCDLRTEVNLLLGIGDGFGMDNVERSKEYLDAALSVSQKVDDKTIELSLLSSLGPKYERLGDYYKQLTEFEQKRVEISRELGNRLWEGHALMFCGQIQAIYLGDYEGGLKQVQEAVRLWENTKGRLYPLLRYAQIQTELGNFDEARDALDTAKSVSEADIFYLGRAGYQLVHALLYLSLGDRDSLTAAIDCLERTRQLVADELVSSQYQIAADNLEAAIRYKLRETIETEDERQENLQRMLECSTRAVELYNTYDFLQIVECTTEDIYYRHSQALSANGLEDEAKKYLEMAYNEINRKHAFIPEDTLYYRTFIENIATHREVYSDYNALGSV
jgi:predicted ATPase/class 3 adenylate cyclase